MLGKLTRWLRIIGYDVVYFRNLDDEQLINIAKKECRILLTRDLKLYRLAYVLGLNVYIVDGVTGTEKLANLAKRYALRLDIDIAVSRCPKCNTRIKPILKESVVNRVPEGTLSNYDEFWECPRCKQIYWRGAHWKRIDETLREAKNLHTAINPG